MSTISTLEIPQDILDTARLTIGELRVELAVYLYAEGRLSIGKARELAEMTLWEFRQLLASRRIPPHYDVADLDEDVATLMDFHIRSFRDDDLDTVVDLSLLAWEPVFESFQQVLGMDIYHLIWPDWRASQREVVEKACNDAEKITWVAEADDAVVGFVACEMDDEKEIGEIYLLAVHPDDQNHGIGAELNRVALEKMKERGMKMATVETGGDPGHAPARRAYEKVGFVGLPVVRYFKDL